MGPRRRVSWPWCLAAAQAQAEVGSFIDEEAAMEPRTQPRARRVATLTLERPVATERPAAPELAPACRPANRAARRAARRLTWRLGCGRRS
ncbi:hypothetical protein Pa4123_49980 [Phytohabitans aurantiacus]|uniref:Uncharacterized protein n=1 Tax=Phytohabitans aurantiacus TaxID=3016789 RepID=A0ABQ5QZK9_9ACTN|nr:hypothetical protein Pa4123_49980 [Phytohabitans aurantiacus]